MLLTIEGFDHLAVVADLDNSDKWGLVSSTASLITGRGGVGKALKFVNDNHYAHTTFPAKTTMVVGFAYYQFTQSSTEEIFGFMTGNTVQMRLTTLAAGSMQVQKGSATIETTATSPISLATWHWIEFKVYFHNTAGTYELKVDGNVVASGTNLDTLYAGSDCDGARFYGQDQDNAFDDIYLLDITGSINNDFLGDCKVETLYPSAEGVTNIDWTPSTGTDNSALVDDPVNDADDVSSSTVNDEDLYVFDDLGAGSDTVFGVQVVARGEKDDTGPRSIALRTVDDPSGTPGNQTGSDKGLVNGTLSYYAEMFETYDGSNLWTASKVDAAEFGIKLTE